MKQLQDELLEREKAFWGAASDPDFFRNNMTENGLAVIGGSVMTRADAVKSTGAAPEKWAIRDSKNWPSGVIRAPAVRSQICVSEFQSKLKIGWTGMCSRFLTRNVAGTFSAT